MVPWLEQRISRLMKKMKSLFTSWLDFCLSLSFFSFSYCGSIALVLIVCFLFFFLKVLDFPIIKKRHCGLCCSYLKSNNSNKLMGGPRLWQCCPGESPEPKTTAPQTQRGSEQLLWLAARWVLPKISSSLEIAHVCIIHVWNSSLQLENHKAAINKWNSGENPFRNIMHAFSVVY